MIMPEPFAPETIRLYEAAHQEAATEQSAASQISQRCQAGSP